MGDAREKTPTEALDARAMERALDLARRAAGRTAPNPMVGCVLVKDDRFVGEGWHIGPGEDHAETMALKAAGCEARSATAYVTLEPCNHTGQTGPCTEALISAGVSEVVYALADPNPLAAGGAEALRAAGVKVRSGLCEEQARHVNRAWLHALKTGRPYITAKSAMSLDGRIATASGESQWITAPESRRAAHELRAEADVILVGAGTVIADDPALTARLESETRYPLRVVLDSSARTSPGAKVYERTGRGAVLATTARASASRLDAFREMGVNILVLPAYEKGRSDLDALLASLFEQGARHLLVEGGGEVIGAFFDADLIDEMALFIAPKLIGGGRPAFAGTGVGALADADRFAFQEVDLAGPDRRLIGVRRGTV